MAERPNHDNLRRLTVDIEKFLTSGEDINLLPYTLFRFIFFVGYAKHSPVAFVLKGLDSSLQIRSQCPALTSMK